MVLARLWSTCPLRFVKQDRLDSLELSAPNRTTNTNRRSLTKERIGAVSLQNIFPYLNEMRIPFVLVCVHARLELSERGEGRRLLLVTSISVRRALFRVVFPPRYACKTHACVPSLYGLLRL